MKVRGQDPSSADHIFTLISSPPERTTTPDGKNLQLSTHPMWPSSTRCKKILHHWHKRMLNYIPWYLQYPHPIPIAFLLQMNTLLDHHLIYPYTTTKEKINIKNSDCNIYFNYHIQCIRSVQGEGAFNRVYPNINSAGRAQRAAEFMFGYSYSYARDWSWTLPSPYTLLSVYMWLKRSWT